MKVYHPKTGEVYEGEPVDCRELMQVGGYVKQNPAETPVAQANPEPTASTGAAGGKVPAPTQAALDSALGKLPAAIAAGEYKDPDYVVRQMKPHFGPDLFTADVEARIRAMFASRGKSADQTPGKSAKIGK